MAVDALDTRLAGLALAVDAATGRLPEAPVAAAREVLTRAGERRALAGGLTVVALAGSTGSGKSSLVNSLVEAPVARVGVTRPTTARPLAALWADPGEAAPLLDWLGVPDQHVVSPGPPDGPDPMAGLVLIDLPDLDSTHATHRAVADHLLDRVDVMVWVTDPEKYADALVHDDYLRRFARHAEVMLVVLNQVDRLDDRDAAACLADLRSLVVADGLDGVRLLATSARSGIGVAALRAELAGVVGARRGATLRLSADVGTAADALAAVAADTDADTAERSPRAAPGVTAGLTDALVEAAGTRLVEDAMRRSVRLRGARATGWPPARWLHRLRRDPLTRLRLGRTGVEGGLVRTSLPSASPVAVASATSAARQYAAVASRGAPAAWVRSCRAVAVGAAESVGPDLDSAVARADVATPPSPRWWRLVGGLQLVLAVVACLGGAWLLGLVGLRALALPAPQPPAVGRLPVPTALLLGGALAGLLLSWVARLLTRLTARRAAARARRAIVARIGEVAQRRIADPVTAELATLAQFRAGLAAAQDGRA